MIPPLRRTLLLAAIAAPLGAWAVAPPGALAQDEPVPAEPAPAPPAPASLPDHPAPAPPPAAPVHAAPLQLPPGMEALPDGAWRLRFPAGAAAVPEAAVPALSELGRRLSDGPPGRVAILAQASGPEDVSTARRLSLARGLAVKQALASGGLPETRIDIRPMGRTPDRLDSADIQPPPPRGPRADKGNTETR